MTSSISVHALRSSACGRDSSMGPKKFGKPRRIEQTPVTRKRRRVTGDDTEFAECPGGSTKKQQFRRSPKRPRTGSPKQPQTGSPKRPLRQDAAGGSESARPGIYKPEVQTEPVPTLPAEFCLFEKYQKMTVLCDRNYKLPTRVYFVKKKGGWKRVDTNKVEPVDKEDFFEVMYHDDLYIGDNLSGMVEKGSSSSLVPPGFLSPKWRKNASSPNKCNGDLDDVLALFEDLGSVLRYGEKGKWITDEVRFRNHLKKIDELYDENPILATKYQDGDLLRAFCKRMNNSAGKNALKHIIDMALMVSFGRKAIRRSYVNCSSVGGGPDKTERFPVKQTPSNLYHEGDGARKLRDRSSPRSSDPFGTSKVKRWIADEVGPSVSEANAGVSETGPPCSEVMSKASSIQFVKLPDGGVYADVISVSGCEPNWPHFLLIGEVKSASEESDAATLSEASKSQLVREMLGTMLHQSIVFGILMSDTRALLCSMNLDFDKRKIRVTFQQYGFLCGISLREFSHMSLTRLFLDLVDALNYSKENIKAVCHWPLTCST